MYSFKLDIMDLWHKLYRVNGIPFPVQIIDTALNVFLSTANEKGESRNIHSEEYISSWVFSTLCIFLNLSRVHVSLFISGCPLPSLCHPYGTVGQHIKNWASTTSRVFASDMRPNIQTHLVILTQAISVHIAVTCWVTCKSSVIDFVVDLPCTLRRNSKLLCME